MPVSLHPCPNCVHLPGTNPVRIAWFLLACWVSQLSLLSEPMTWPHTRWPCTRWPCTKWPCTRWPCTRWPYNCHVPPTLKHIALRSQTFPCLRSSHLLGAGKTQTQTMANLAKKVRRLPGSSLYQGSSHAYSPANVRDLREEPKRLAQMGLWPQYTAHLQPAG
jgi:hypothetical protein